MRLARIASQIRIGDAYARQRARLDPLHCFRILAGFVIEPQKMQTPV
jgi:hypothetical protein